MCFVKWPKGGVKSCIQQHCEQPNFSPAVFVKGRIDTEFNLQRNQLSVV